MKAQIKNEEMETFFKCRPHKNRLIIREYWAATSFPLAEEAKGKCNERVLALVNWLIENKWPLATVEYSGGGFEDIKNCEDSITVLRGCVIALVNKKENHEH